MSEELDLSAILSQDNPEDGGMFEGMTADAPTVPAQPAPEQQEQPVTQEQEQQQPATVTDANPFPEGEPQHKAFERVREAAREAERKQAEAERELAVARAIQERDQQWQQSMQQQAQQQPEEIPDPIVDPEGHARWVRDQISREVSKVKQEFDQREQQRQQAEYQRETQRLIGEAGAPVEAIQAALAHVQQSQPWMVAGLNQAPNPFKAVLDYAKSIGFNAPTTTQAQATSDAIPDHIRQKVLADEAAKRAAAGAPPQMQLPRGVGNGPTGAGFNDGLPPPSEYSKLSSAEYDALKAKILSQ